MNIRIISTQDMYGESKIAKEKIKKLGLKKVSFKVKTAEEAFEYLDKLLSLGEIIVSKSDDDNSYEFEIYDDYRE